jgi:ankyrin repeat protein
MRFRAMALAALLACLAGTTAHAAISLDDLLNAADLGNNTVVMDGIRRGMDADSCDEAGLSLLMRASREGNLELVDFLLRNRANVRASTSWGDTAILLASQKGHAKVIARLIEGGAEVNGAPKTWSPILYAAMEGHADVVRQLLDKGADPNARAPSLLTPLMIASRSGHIDIVRMLLAAKADPNLTNDRGDSALGWALAAGNTQIGDLLKSGGAK